MSETLFPYDVFRVDRPDPSVGDEKFGAYQFPSGEVGVFTNNFSKSNILFESKDEADAFLNQQKGYSKGEIIELNPKDYPKDFDIEFRINFEENDVSKGSTSQNRAERSQPAIEASKSGEKIAEDETNQQDRAETKNSDNNLPNNLLQNTIDDALNQNNLSRAGRSESETTGDRESIGDRIEGAVSDFFGNGQRAASVLKGQLDDYIDEGGDPMLAALGATALDVTSFSMGFVQSNVTGLIDTRNLGEGIKQGTWEGVKEDAERFLNVIPQGRIARVINSALTVSAVVEASNAGDAKSLAMEGGGALAGVLTKGRKGKKGKGKGSKTVLPKENLKHMTTDVEFSKKYISKEKLTVHQRNRLKKRVQELHNAMGNKKARGLKTTAIVIARDQTGKLVTLVSSSQTSLPREVREKLRRNEVQCPGNKKPKGASDKDHFHHAEVNGINVAISSGFEIVEIFPSRNACPLCAEMRAGLGIIINNP